MNKPTKIEGRVWVIKDGKQGIDNIDTDMIYHNKHLAITHPDEMKNYIFGNLDGWQDFPEKAEDGDILIVGENFGAGSSRQQAVDGIVALGIRAIIGESFGAIYWRNAVNAALPILRAPGIMASEIESGNRIEVDFTNGRTNNISTGCEIDNVQPMNKIQLDIYRAGGLFNYSKTYF